VENSSTKSVYKKKKKKEKKEEKKKKKKREKTQDWAAVSGSSLDRLAVKGHYRRRKIAQSKESWQREKKGY